MFSKIVKVGAIVGAVAVSYMLLSITAPLVADMASSANVTISASSNMTNYPGLQGALLGSPLWLYFVPAVFGVVLIVLVLRAP